MRRVSFIVAAMLAIGTASAEAQSPVLGPYAEFTTGGAGHGALLGGEVGMSRSSKSICPSCRRALGVARSSSF